MRLKSRFPHTALCLRKSIKQVNGGVLIERAHYHTILVEGVRTIREGVLIEEGALTEVVRYSISVISQRFIFLILGILTLTMKSNHTAQVWPV